MDRRGPLPASYRLKAMTISKKFNSALLAVGFVAAMAIAASPASAQSGAQAGSIGLKAGKDGSFGRVSATVTLPAGASISGKVLRGKRVLCVARKKKANADGTPTEIGCRFPLRALKVKKSRASQDGQYAGFVVLSLAVREVLLLDGVQIPAGLPIALTIPFAAATFEKDYQ